MITTRVCRPEDMPKINSLASKHNINVPQDGILIVAVDEKEEIKGFINMRMVMMVEPLVSDAPRASVKLWQYVVNRARLSGVPIIRAFIKNKNKKLLEKVGFYEIFSEDSIMEINFHK